MDELQQTIHKQVLLHRYIQLLPRFQRNRMNQQSTEIHKKYLYMEITIDDAKSALKDGQTVVKSILDSLLTMEIKTYQDELTLHSQSREQMIIFKNLFQAAQAKLNEAQRKIKVLREGCSQKKTMLLKSSKTSLVLESERSHRKKQIRINRQSTESLPQLRSLEISDVSKDSDSLDQKMSLKRQIKLLKHQNQIKLQALLKRQNMIESLNHFYKSCYNQYVKSQRKSRIQTQQSDRDFDQQQLRVPSYDSIVYKLNKIEQRQRRKRIQSVQPSNNNTLEYPNQCFIDSLTTNTELQKFFETQIVNHAQNIFKLMNTLGGCSTILAQIE